MHANHRTALFIDGTSLDGGEFKERVGRLLQSVNGENIKVDTYVVTPNAGVEITAIEDLSDVPNGTDDELVAFDVEALRKQASQAGYKQILFSVAA